LSNRRTEPFRSKATRPGQRSGSISLRDRNRRRRLRRGSQWPLGKGNRGDGNIGRPNMGRRMAQCLSAPFCWEGSSADAIFDQSRIGQPQADPVSYYYHGRHYPYRYHGHYYDHRAWHGGITGVTIRRTTCFDRFRGRPPQGVYPPLRCLVEADHREGQWRRLLAANGRSLLC
jgi:hypothetical protein